MRLEDDPASFLDTAYFQGRKVSFREGTVETRLIKLTLFFGRDGGWKLQDLYATEALQVLIWVYSSISLQVFHTSFPKNNVRRTVGSCYLDVPGS